MFFCLFFIFVFVFGKDFFFLSKKYSGVQKKKKKKSSTWGKQSKRRNPYVPMPSPTEGVFYRRVNKDPMTYQRLITVDHG